MRFGFSGPRLAVAALLLAAAGVVHELFGNDVLSRSVLAASGVVLLSAFVVRRDQCEPQEDPVDELERRGLTWMTSTPVRMPSREDFDGGDRVVVAVEALGAPGLSRVAERMMLLLSIQWGKAWWTWFQRLEDDADTPLLLMIPLATIDIPWVRVSYRAAHLAQCLDPAVVDDAVSAHFGNSPRSSHLEKLLDAVRSRTVGALLAQQVQAECVGYRKTAMAELFDQFAQADAALRCSDLP